MPSPAATIQTRSASAATTSTRRVPDVSEMEVLLCLARERLADGQIWINQDCGLKTRQWEEVRPALVNMVEAACRLRTAANTDKPTVA
jgi:methionine synthase II (cobalamin-independent)